MKVNGDDSATFLATIPPILAGIRFSGDGDARIMLDAPESEIAQVTKLLLMRGKVLRVTIAPEEAHGAPRRTKQHI